ncbi:hypothetical protein Tco_0854360 [Tanacetum coccineum]
MPPSLLAYKHSKVISNVLITKCSGIYSFFNRNNEGIKEWKSIKELERIHLASAAICTNGGVTSYTAEFEKKAKDERKRYIDLVEKSMKDIIKDVFKNQLPHILAKEISEFATPVIQSTITESLENVFLAKSASQPKSTFNAATLLTEFELKKILLDKMQKTYYLKRDHEDKDKDEDPPAGLDQGLKKQKTSKDVLSHPAKAETRGETEIRQKDEKRSQKRQNRARNGRA